MTWWMLLLFLTFTWLVWLVGSVLGTRLDVIKGRRPTTTGVSILPGFPGFPLIFFATAKLVDLLVPSWGTLVIGVLHGVLLVLFIILIFRDVIRGSISQMPKPGG